MGYTLYLCNTEKIENENDYFTDSEWHSLSRVVARLVVAWDKKHRQIWTDDCNCDFIEYLEDGTKEEKEKRLADIFIRDGKIQMYAEGWCESILILKTVDENWGYHYRGFLFCKTGQLPIYNDLAVAIFQVASDVTDGRIRFSHDGDFLELIKGRKFLYDTIKDFAR